VIAEAPVPPLDPDALLRVLAEFHGTIDQIPPMHSALKHEGRRLYELARAGLDVERAPRRIRIHALELICIEGADLTLDLRCSKGTYVRTLVEDVAEQLGTHGHVTALRRRAVGPYGG